MTRRTVVTTGLSLILALALVAGLVSVARLDMTALRHLVQSARLDACCGLFLLVSLNALLAGEKWRLVDRHLGGGHLPRTHYGTFSVLGQAVGQVLPTQIAYALTRSAGTWLTLAGGATRSAAGTLVEQVFDLAVIAALAVASLAALATGTPWVWLATAAVALAALARLAGPALRLLERRVAAANRLSHNPVIAAFRRVLVSCLALDDGLVRQLIGLSIIRFAVLCAMAAMTTLAGGFDIPVLQFVIALPLVVLAAVLPLTPAGLGVIEGTFVATLVVQGTPLETAIQWALLNRVLVAASSGLAGVCALVVALVVGRRRVAMTVAEPGGALVRTVQ